MEQRELIDHLVTQINGNGDLRESMSLLTASLQELSGCEAVGIRLREHENFPYFENRGFPLTFFEAERSLCSHDEKGEPERESTGNPRLECMCGNILSGRYDPAQPFYTDFGSFWTNSLTTLLEDSTSADLQGMTRSKCHREGYESVALIPLHIENRALGLIQFNDHCQDRFTAESIAYFESMAITLALALSRRQLLIQLQEKEEMYRIVANFTYAMEAWRKPDGTYGYVSPSCERITGHSADEFLSSPNLLMDITHPEDFPEVIEHFQLSRKENKDLNQGLDFRIITPGGEIRWLGHSCIAVYSDKGEWLGRRESYREITKRKDMEKESTRYQAKYWQLRKDKSLERMAGAVAHHFNNKFHVLINCLEIAMLNLGKIDETQKYLKIALNSANQAALVSKSLLIYLGQVTDSSEQIDLADACRKALSLIQPTISNDVTIEIDFTFPGPLILSNEALIRQIVATLLTNASEAIGGDQGTIQVRVHTVDESDIPRQCRYPADWQPKDKHYACLEVRDSGCGMSLSETEVIFDPFYTSKFTGRGMGLAMVFGLVQAHGGVVTVESSPDVGSTFRVFYPMAVEKVPSARQKPVSHKKLGVRGTVLLVDDDEIVLKMSKTLLSHLGFTVLVSTNGSQAVELFKKRKDDIILVLSDFSMPEMNGMEALQILRGMDPELPMILTSGYSEEEVMRDNYKEKPDFFLKKPYDLRSLQNAIQYSLKNI